MQVVPGTTVYQQAEEGFAMAFTAHHLLIIAAFVGIVAWVFSATSARRA